MSLIYKFCTYCGERSKFGDIPKCSGCKMTYYCNKVCQQRDWKQHSNICKTLSAGRIIDAKEYQRFCAVNVDVMTVLYDKYYSEAITAHKTKFGTYPKYCFMVYEMEKDILLNDEYLAAVKGADSVSPFNAPTAAPPQSAQTNVKLTKYIAEISRASDILHNMLTNGGASDAGDCGFSYNLVCDIHAFAEWDALIRSVKERSDDKFVKLLWQMKSDLDDAKLGINEGEVICVLVLQLKNVLLYTGAKVLSA